MLNAVAIAKKGFRDRRKYIHVGCGRAFPGAHAPENPFLRSRLRHKVSLPKTSCEPVDAEAALPAYAELHCLSNFTFLRGASHPHELVERAEALGYTALALTDECSVAGVVRAHMATKNRRIKLIVGAEFRLTCGLKLAVLATSRRGYGRLCRLITRARRAAEK